MTELSFLLELLLKHDLKQETKLAIADRIREVEEKLNKVPMIPTPAASVRSVPSNVQIPAHIPQEVVPLAAPLPPAMPARQAAIGVAGGTVDKLTGQIINPATGRPRKF